MRIKELSIGQLKYVINHTRDICRRKKAVEILESKAISARMTFKQLAEIKELETEA